MSHLSFLIAAATLATAVMAQTCPKKTCVFDAGNQPTGLCKTGKCHEYCTKNHGGCDSECRDTGDGKTRCVCILPTENGGCTGDPHYWTFDGMRHHYMGKCRSTDVRPCRKTKSLPNFSVSQTNSGPFLTALDTVYLTVEEWDLEVEVKATTAKVNGNPISFPFRKSYDGKYQGHIHIWQWWSRIIVQTSFGLELRRYFFTLDVNIPAHPELRGNTCGTLGKWDGDHTNDLTAKDGTEHSYDYWVWDFGNSWCEDGGATSKSSQAAAMKNKDKAIKACEKDTGRKQNAEALCSPLKNVPNTCSAGKAAFDNCVTDVCVTPGRKEREAMACNSVQGIGEICGIKLSCA